NCRASGRSTPPKKRKNMKNAVATQREEQVARENGAPEDRYLSPTVNIFETQDRFILEAEMPGVNKDSLEITLEGNALTLVGRRSEERFPNSELLYRESRPANFRRVFELNPTIDTGKIHANMEQGVLTLTLPKQEKVKPRKITV